MTMDSEQQRAVEALVRMQFPLPAQITIEVVAGAGTRFRVVTQRAERTLFIGQQVFEMLPKPADLIQHLQALTVFVNLEDEDVLVL
jgi:hypothetical protein